MRVNSNGLRLNLSSTWTHKEILQPTLFPHRLLGLNNILNNFLANDRLIPLGLHLALGSAASTNRGSSLTIFFFDSSFDSLESGASLLKESFTFTFFLSYLDLYLYRKIYFLFVRYVRAYSLFSKKSPLHLRFVILNKAGHISAAFVAAYVARKLLVRFKLNKILPTVFRDAFAHNPRLLGISFLCSGRFDKKERAQLLRLGEGPMPFGDLGCSVDYSVAKVPLKYGVCGIKVWLFSRGPLH